MIPTYILIILCVLIILIILILIIGKKCCDIAIRPEIAQKYSDLVFTPEQKNILNKTKEQCLTWLEKNTEEVEIISYDGLKLKGYEIKQKNDTDVWVIAVHGYLGKGADMATAMEKFKSFGYNGLIIDLRAHNKSEGKYVGMGWLDHFDLIMWINKIIEYNKNSKIILYGISMGAATVCMTIGEEIPENVKCAISDCAYTSTWDEFKLHLKKIFHIHSFPILYSASLMSKIFAGYRFKEASAVKQIQKSNVPTLFIHGKCDKFVPFQMLNKLYESASCPKEKLEIEDATHAESSTINPEKYWQKIEEFTKKYLN